ncbi:hypothetical protein T439DRAFT_359890 [Meredithblackwellia eburnea MCA 4105]
MSVPQPLSLITHSEPQSRTRREHQDQRREEPSPELKSPNSPYSPQLRNRAHSVIGAIWQSHPSNSDSEQPVHPRDQFTFGPHKSLTKTLLHSQIRAQFDRKLRLEHEIHQVHHVEDEFIRLKEKLRVAQKEPDNNNQTRKLKEELEQLRSTYPDDGAISELKQKLRKANEVLCQHSSDDLKDVALEKWALRCPPGDGGAQQALRGWG